MAPVIRFQENFDTNSSLDPVLTKDSESEVRFDGFCDHFCANLVKVVLPEDKNAFYRVFKPKHSVAVNGKLVQLLPLHNFCVHNFSRFCENFNANLGNVSYRLVFRTFLVFLFGNLVNHQQQTCSAAQTAQLLCLHLFTLLRPFLHKSWKSVLSAVSRDFIV